MDRCALRMSLIAMLVYSLFFWLSYCTARVDELRATRVGIILLTKSSLSFNR